MKTIEQIQMEIKTRSVKYRTENIYIPMFAGPTVLRQSERKKARLENSGWTLLRSYQGMLVYVKEA